MKRILLKISGEALSSEWWSIDPWAATELAEMIHKIKKTGLELVLVLGGGNIYRGSNLIAAGVDPADSHNMSMLSTVFNAVTLKNFLEKLWESVEVELHCDAMIKLTKVDGVYESDPVKNPDAKKIDALSYNEFITKDLKVLDQTAIIMARDNNLPIYVTKLGNIENITSIVSGKTSGTKIS